MGKYTEMCSDALERYSVDEDGIEYLDEQMKKFRGSNEALTEFITQFGYSGDRKDTREKAEFLRNKFKENEISEPRNLRDFRGWFEKPDGFQRKNAFKICFALKLSIQETNDFFRRVFQERSFDFHSKEELIYYFCLSTGKAFKEAEGMMMQLPEISKSNIDFSDDVLYTSVIKREVTECNEEELLKYIKDHQKQFQYRNVKGSEIICNLWKRIAEEGPETSEYNSKDWDIAKQEGKLIKEQLNEASIDRAIYGEDKYNSQSVDNVNKRKIANRSVDSIYAQIIGKYHKVNDNRSMNYLKNNNYLHQSVANNFPNRQSLEKVLRGERVEYETIRKTIILLVFYYYCARKIIEQKDVYYEFSEEETNDYIAEINSYLGEADYPELYIGNAYDWIFLYSLRAKPSQPLETFRLIIEEANYRKNEQK